MPETLAPRPPAAAPAALRRRLLVLCGGIVLVSLNLRAIITVVGPLEGDIRADLGLSRTAVGVLSTAPLLAWGLVSPLVPRLGARFGSDRTLVASMVVLAAMLVVRTLPPTALLFAGTLVAGCALAVANVLLPALIKQHFPARAALTVATYSIVLGIGAALAAGLAVPSMHWLGGSWRAAFAIWAIPALLGALAWLPQLREAAQAPPPEAVPVRVRIWRDPVAWQVTGFLAFVALLFYSVAAWLPDIYRTHGFSAAHAGGLLSLALIIGLPLGVLVGLAAERLHDQRPIAILSVAFAAAGYAGILFAPLFAPWLWTAFLSFGFGSAFPLVLALVVLRAPDVEHAAELSGMSQSIGYAVGALGPVAIGALHDASGGWTLPLVVLLACTAPAMAVAVAASRPRFVGGAPIAPRQRDGRDAGPPA